MNRPFNMGSQIETDKEKLRKQIDELKETARMERKPVSKCIEELYQYMNDHKDDDFLVHSTGSGAIKRPNPFTEKKRCCIL